MKLSLDSLGKTFRSRRGTVQALKELSLSIEDGELFVFLGPSGCGKSTVLNLAAGLEKPSTGEIRFDDQVMASAGKKIFFPPRQRDVAMVFQSYALYPHLSVFDNIAFPLRVGGENPKRIRDAVHKTASTLGIGNLLEARPAELSGGQRQRVAIARAIVRKPRLFLLDEPLSNLDANLRTSTRAELKVLQRKLRVTTLYVTHDQVEAMTLADRMAILKDGKLMQTGSPGEIYNNPDSPFVASFVGSPPMNLIPFSYRVSGGKVYLMLGSEALALSGEQGQKPRKRCGKGYLFRHPAGARDFISGRPETRIFRHAHGPRRARTRKSCCISTFTAAICCA